MITFADILQRLITAQYGTQRGAQALFARAHDLPPPVVSRYLTGVEPTWSRAVSIIESAGGDIARALPDYPSGSPDDLIRRAQRAEQRIATLQLALNEAYSRLNRIHQSATPPSTSTVPAPALARESDQTNYLTNDQSRPSPQPIRVIIDEDEAEYTNGPWQLPLEPPAPPQND